LPFRSIKKDFIFKEKYKTLLECLSKGKNPEINTLLVNHVREIDKLDKKPLNKTELASQSKLLLDNHFEKIKKFCKDQSISFGKCNIDFIGYFYSHYPKALFDDKGNYLLAKLLDKLYLIITELNKYNNVASTFT
jgi:hypothetical protein